MSQRLSSAGPVPELLKIISPALLPFLFVHRTISSPPSHTITTPPPLFSGFFLLIFAGLVHLTCLSYYLPRVPACLVPSTTMASIPRDINAGPEGSNVNASQNLNLSSSPSASFQSHSPSHGSSALTNRTIPLPNAKHLKPFATEDIKVLLLENVNQTGREILTKQGYQVEFLKSSLPEDQLIEKIRFVRRFNVSSPLENGLTRTPRKEMCM